MANSQNHMRPAVYFNFRLVDEQSSANLIEKEDGIFITITSTAPLAGFELDPDIGQEDRLDIFFSLDIKTRAFLGKLIEKKFSWSASKGAYQILTYKSIKTLDGIMYNKEIKHNVLLRTPGDLGCPIYLRSISAE